MRKKYLKHLGGNFTYKFICSWRIKHVQTLWVYDKFYKEPYDFISPNESLDDDITHFVERAEQFLEQAFNDDAEMLSQYLYNDTGILADLSFTIDGNHIMTILFAKNALSNEQLQTFMKWFKDQYGIWGDGRLEQNGVIYTRQYHDYEEVYAHYMHYDIPQSCNEYISFDTWCNDHDFDIPEKDTDEYDDLYYKYEDTPPDCLLEEEFSIDVNGFYDIKQL